MFIAKLTLTVDDKTAHAYLKERGFGVLATYRSVDRAQDATKFTHASDAQAAYAEYAKGWRNPPTLTIEEVA